ncbi:MAG: hypothetical protein MJ180_04365 [Candidatus Gastranaerophilales bacterium]|nr:hypothetical protein [Candidatus Gastranaerophilales bacterium]
MDIQQTNLNFGAKSIYPLKIRKFLKRGTRLVKADFAELSPYSKKDAEVVRKLKELWKYSTHQNNYIHDIANAFKDDSSFFTPDYKYFMVRLNNGKMPSRIASVALVKTEDSVLKLNILQSSTYANTITPLPKLKGAGELNLLGLVKYAKTHLLKKIELKSTNNSFYDKLVFSKVLKEGSNLSDLPTHVLESSKFDEFISKIEQKYKII